MKGKFVTFEGCEGSGKSTQVNLLKDYLDKNHIEYIFTREPGGTEIAEKIRKIILDIDNKAMTDECEALLYSAARAQHIKEKILPALSQGKLVLCDRYIDSSFAYQAYSRGLGFDFIESINKYAIENCMPDYTIFFDIPPKDAFARKGGMDKDDRLEQQGLKFHEGVYNGYKECAKKYSDRFVVIDAHCSIEEMHNNIIKVFEDKIIKG